jgi:hypothetical protein
MNGRAELCASDQVKSRRSTRLLVFSSGLPLHTRKKETLRHGLIHVVDQFFLNLPQKTLAKVRKPYNWRHQESGGRREGGGGASSSGEAE